MIAGLMHWRTYLIAALGFGAVVFLLSTVTNLGDSLVIPALLRMRGSAVAVGMAPVIADVIIMPLVTMLSSDIAGALFAALLWPLVALWLLLVVLMFFFTVLGSGFTQAANTIR